MKRTITLLSFLLFSATVLFANPVDPEKALETATEFWKSKVGKSSAAGSLPESMMRLSSDTLSLRRSPCRGRDRFTCWNKSWRRSRMVLKQKDGIEENAEP